MNKDFLEIVSKYRNLKREYDEIPESCESERESKMEEIKLLSDELKLIDQEIPRHTGRCTYGDYIIKKTRR